MFVRLSWLPVALALGACALQPSTSTPLDSGVIKGNFDPQVNPGDDFYRYVNGRWLATTSIPADRSNYGTFTILQDQAEAQLREIVESADPDAAGNAGKIAALYASFMDQQRLQALGTEPLEDMLARIDRLGAPGTDNTLPLLLADLMRIGVTVPLAASVYQDARDATRYSVYISQSGLGLPDREYYLSDDKQFSDLRQDYRLHVGNMLRLAGSTTSEREAEAVLALETQLAQTHWTRVESRDREKTYNPVPVAELPATAPGFDWGAWLSALGNPPDRVILRQRSAIEDFARASVEVPAETWRAYLRFHLLTAYAAFLPSAFEDENFAFFGTRLRGIESPRERWKRGVGVVEANMGEALGELYVERHFPPQARERMNRLVENLKRAYAQSIRSLDWMGEETRREALVKLSLFTTKIGHPEQWRDYSALEIDESDLIGNVRRGRQFAFDTMYAKLGQPVDRDEWFMTPQTVNAYYNPGMNEIVFPAAILQPPFFNVDADDAINYGAIGAVIGHEIGHGFDDQGSRYDGLGNLRNWWTEADRERFEARTAALIGQYNAYCPLEGHCVNGALSIGENIGDLGGLSIAYKAYQLALEDRSAQREGFTGEIGDGAAAIRPETLDGYSGDQRFFIGWAQVWARLYREQELINRLKTGPHAPDEFRTNGVVRNIDAWYEAFDVQPDAELYLPPEQRVRIW
jgi:putative endopeptidase